MRGSERGQEESSLPTTRTGRKQKESRVHREPTHRVFEPLSPSCESLSQPQRSEVSVPQRSEVSVSQRSECLRGQRSACARGQRSACLRGQRVSEVSVSPACHRGQRSACVQVPFPLEDLFSSTARPQSLCPSPPCPRPPPTGPHSI